MHSPRLFLQLAVLASALLLGAVPTQAEAQTSPPERGCQRHDVAVSLIPGTLATKHVATWLCARGPLASNRTVQVLLSGNTYGSVYWDFPYQLEGDDDR